MIDQDKHAVKLQNCYERASHRTDVGNEVRHVSVMMVTAVTDGCDVASRETRESDSSSSNST